MTNEQILSFASLSPEVMERDGPAFLTEISQCLSQIDRRSVVEGLLRLPYRSDGTVADLIHEILEVLFLMPDYPDDSQLVARPELRKVFQDSVQYWINLLQPHQSLSRRIGAVQIFALYGQMPRTHIHHVADVVIESLDLPDNWYAAF
jgi:hypothetical protein